MEPVIAVRIMLCPGMVVVGRRSDTVVVFFFFFILRGNIRALRIDDMSLRSTLKIVAQESNPPPLSNPDLDTEGQNFGGCNLFRKVRGLKGAKDYD